MKVKVFFLFCHLIMLISANPKLINASEAPKVTSLKPPLQGLVDRQGLPPENYRKVVNGFVLQVNWADLQPEAGSELAEANIIDQTIAEIRELNCTNPGLDLTFKLRVYCGIHAPEWAKRIGGPPIPIIDPENDSQYTIGRFWLSEYGKAYDDLQRKLALRYDAVPELRLVAISRCGTIYAEPFIRQVRDKQTARALLDAGFSFEADKKAHYEAIESHQVWKYTRSSLAFNPYQKIAGDGRVEVDDGFTKEMVRYFRQTLGERAVIANYSIRWPLQTPYLGMYETIRKTGAPIHLQTATPEKIGDWRRTLEWAIRQGANAVELNRKYSKDYPLEELRKYDQMLSNNRYKLQN